MTERRIPVSVIATCYTVERLADLTALLDSLALQSYRNFETILVLEKSRELLEKVTELSKLKDYNGLKILFNAGTGGASEARNIGIREAGGDILAFIDDDAVASPGWLASVVETFAKNSGAVGVTGPILPIWESNRLAWLPEEFYWIVSCMPARAEVFEVRNAWGNNMCFRREAFHKSGLFLTSLGARGGGIGGKHELVGEDTEFCLRARRTCGKSIVCSPPAVVLHRAYAYRFKNSFVARRAYWEGYTKAIFKKSLNGMPEGTLNVEHRLLGRILFRLLPLTLMSFFRHPARSARRLMLITIALAGIATGYARGAVSGPQLIGAESCVEYL